MALAALATVWLTACEPTVVIGSCTVPANSGDAGAGGAADVELEPVGTGWSTSFEDDLCGYRAAGGYCYARHGAGLEMVRSPTPHSGEFAAAFSVTSDTSTVDRSQARCVRQGVMPKSAVYGAWYWVPEVQTSDGNWNLFHFLGGVSEADSHALWDVSLVNDASGGLELSVFDFLGGAIHPSSAGPIPIGSWFHIEVQLVRSAQANGELTVYQDGVVALRLTRLITDDTDWGQWYVGNYARTLVPAKSTVYVDDVTIREER